MPEPQDVKLEVVYKAAGQLEAHIIKGKLESEGIPAMLQYESEVFALTVDGMGEVRILVPEHQAARAREVIARTEEWSDDSDVYGPDDSE
jgi:type 1 glutamine amidotransferase